MIHHYPLDAIEWKSSPKQTGPKVEKGDQWKNADGSNSYLLRMATGVHFLSHEHPNWIHVTVLQGSMKIESTAGELLVTSGNSYFVEPGSSHSETAESDTIALFVEGPLNNE